MKCIKIFKDEKCKFAWFEERGQTVEVEGQAWLESHVKKGRTEANGFTIKTGKREEFQSILENRMAHYPSHDRVQEAIYEKLFENRSEKFDQIQKEREEVKQRFPKNEKS